MPESVAHFGPAIGSRVAGYRIDERVGGNRTSVVFRAFDEALGVPVALQVINRDLAADQAFRDRFLRVTKAAAQLDEPHVIPVFAAGQADGALYVAMRYVSGRDAGKLARRLGPLPLPRVLSIVAAAAAALDAAHATGLVHGGVRPSALLLDERPGGGEHVYLADFGLAAAAAATIATGHLPLTLDCAAPEQILRRPVDGRADQYALACTAVLLLAGASSTPASGAASATALAGMEDGLHDGAEDAAADSADVGPRSVPLPGEAPTGAGLAASAARLTGHDLGIPGTVAAVLHRALASTPGGRYPSCGEFAAALQAAHESPNSEAPVTALTVGLAAGMPATAAATVAAETSPCARSVSAGHSRRRAVPVLIAAMVLLAAGGTGAALILSRSGTPRNTALAQTVSTAPARPATRPSSTGSPGASTPPTAVPTKAAAPASGPVSIARSFADPVGGARHVDSVAVSPDGTLLAAGDADGATSLWAVGSGRLVARLRPAGAAKILAVAFSPDGKLVATGAGDGRTSLWSTATGQLLGTVTDPGGRQVDAVAFSPAGKLLATSDANGAAYLWKLTVDGRPAVLSLTLPDPLGQGVWSLAFSPDGTTLAAGDYRGTTCLWRLTAGADVSGAGPILLAGPSGHPAVTALAFGPDGSTLAAGYYNGSVYLWNATAKGTSGTGITDTGSTGTGSTGAGSTGTGPRRVVTEPGTVWGAAFSGSDVLALGDADGSSYLVDPATGATEGTLRDPGTGSQGVGAVAFTPDGDSLVAGDTNGTTYLWGR